MRKTSLLPKLTRPRLLRVSFDGGCTKFIPVKKKGGGRYWRCAPGERVPTKEKR